MSRDDRRYRKAAKETHPDLNPGKPEAEKRFKEISAAYDIIGDADKRKRYDAILGILRPAIRPDLGNQLKLVEDALNAVVFRDDCLIVDNCCAEYLACAADEGCDCVVVCMMMGGSGEACGGQCGLNAPPPELNALFACFDTASCGDVCM